MTEPQPYYSVEWVGPERAEHLARRAAEILTGLTA